MGLFGFFATMVGLGAMAKDGIERSISETDAYTKAVQEGRSYYYTGNGSQINSTKTRRKCVERIDHITHHRLIIDANSGQVLEDITANQNMKRQMEEAKIIPDYCVFKRVTEYDNLNIRANIWVTDKMPGLYFRHYGKNGNDSKVTEDSHFIKGELADKKNFQGYSYKEVKVVSSNEAYYANGELITNDSIMKKNNEKSKNTAIKNNKKFYKYEYLLYKHENGTINTSYCYKDVDTDTTYIYNVTKKYYTEAMKKRKKINISLPHHEPKYIDVIEYVEIPGKIKYNHDGSRWYEK